MDELDGLTTGEGGHPVASEVAERVRAVIGAAEAAAAAVRSEAESEAQARRRAADEEARHVLEDARSDADAFLAERRRRIAELSDTILERTEALFARLERAEDVKRQLQSLAEALGQTAESLAAEMAVEPLPQVQPRTATEPAEAEPAREPEPEPQPEPVAPVPLRSAEAAAADADIVELPRPSREEPLEDDADDEGLAARLVALQMAVAGAKRGEVAEHLRQNFGTGDWEPVLDDVFGQGSEPDERLGSRNRS